MKITKTLIDRLTCPQKGQEIYRDSELKGFGIRLTRSCKSYIVEGVVNGSRKRVTIGRCDSLNLEEARLLAERTLREGIRDKRESTELTLQDALDAFLSARQMRSYTKQKYRNLVERHLADWLTLPLQAITKDMVEEQALETIGTRTFGALTFDPLGSAFGGGKG